MDSNHPARILYALPYEPSLILSHIQDIIVGQQYPSSICFWLRGGPVAQEGFEPPTFWDQPDTLPD